MFRRNLLLLSVLLLAFSAAGALGQASVSIIRGRVVVPDSSSDRIPIVLEGADGQVRARTYSDSSGNFEFREIDSGKYDVVVQLDGYEEGRQPVRLGTGDISGAVNPLPLDPDNPEVVASTSGASGDASFVNLFLKKRETGVTESPDSAEANAIRKYPKKVVQDYDKALLENRKGDTAAAVVSLGNVLKVAQDFYYGHNLLGTLLQKMDRYRDAEREYKTAHEQRPQMAPPLVNLGSLYIQEATIAFQKEPAAVGAILDEALDALEEAVKLDSQSALAHYLLGTAYYKSTFYEEAEEHLQKALAIDVHMGVVRLALANLYMRQQEFKLALENFDVYLAENPNSSDRAEVLEFRARVLQNLEAGSK